MDGSFFVSRTAVHPALTIIVNALRVADHLAQRFGVLRTADKTAFGSNDHRPGGGADDSGTGA